MKRPLMIALALLSLRLAAASDPNPTSPAVPSSPDIADSRAAEPSSPAAAPPPPVRPRLPKYVPVPTGTPATPPADASKFEIFLLVGQSNMAGRGPLGADDRIADPHVLVLNSADQWVTEGEPIHFDRSVSAMGVGPGYTFAKLLAARKPGVTIGLIPCAFGGTGLLQWVPNARDKTLYPPYTLFENAIRRTQLASASGTLKGILWHQGESDATKKSADRYAARLAPLVASFRASLHLPNVPFIAGEIGHFAYAAHPEYQIVNEQINSLATVIPHYAIASAEGLTDKGDHVHFNTESQKQLAQRYLEAYLKLENASANSTSSKP